ncbi:MAG TPA: CoA-transferase [Bacillota bacterium]|jgi:glutaconate CoA-transferase subunit A
MSARFKAASMGLRFLPTRSPIGSDMLRANRAAMVDCPFTGRPIVLVPACYPNVALIHVQESDPYGNCRIHGQLYTCPEIALTAAHTIVTCERVSEHEEMTRYPNRISIPFFAVDAVVEVPFGAYPGNCYGYYYFDETHIPQFLAAASKYRQADPGPLREYYETYVFGVTDTAAFIDLIPQRQSQHVQRAEAGLRGESGYLAEGARP